MKTNFDLSQDVHVYLEQLPEGFFILGYSELGGSDELGTATPSLVEVTCEIVEAQLLEGAVRIGGISTAFEPATLLLTVRSDDLDPNSNISARPGRPIYFEVDQDVGSGVTLFSGRIEVSSVAYVADAYPTVKITAKSKLKEVQQDLYTFSKSAGEQASSYLDEVFEQHGIYASGFNDSGVALFAAHNYQETQGFEILQSVMNGELGYLALSRDGYYYYFFERGNAPSGATLDIGSNHSTSANHLCANSSANSYSSDLVPNYISAYLESDPENKIVFADYDSIDLMGRIAYEFELELQDLDELGLWGTAAKVSTAGFTIENISTPAIDRAGNLTNAATETAPLTPIQVTLDYRGATIDREMLIGRVTHIIDVDNWFTELELWSK